MNSGYPRIEKALEKYGFEKFCKDAQNLLDYHPNHKVVLGLFGGPSTGRYNFSYTAGKQYPRPAVRYTRKNGYEGIRLHAGPYLWITI